MENNKDIIKKERIEVSDEAALEVLSTDTVNRVKIGTKFVPRTIVYPAVMEYQPGVKTTEIRFFVRMYEWVSPSQWEKALRIEKKYAKLNKKFTDDLKAGGFPVTAKEPGNLLNATILDLT